MNIISLGAGVQSSTMGEMANQGEITPMPDAAIFADTQWEPKAVYEWLEFLEKRWKFPIYRVTAGNLRKETLEGMQRGNLSLKTAAESRRFSVIPWHMKMPNGDGAMGRRQCTRDFKVSPIRKQIRKLLNNKLRCGACSMWIGISRDEAYRMKPSNVRYIENRWPLIDLLMTRNDCLRWWQKRGLPIPPKSSCIGCPYHNDKQWRDIKADPVAWADAVEIDRSIRNQAKMKSEQFMHRSLMPLDKVDFSTDEDRGQLNMFNNECEGMCGV